jgi:hypothetical protein
MANKSLKKKSSASSAIGEIQIKTTLRFLHWDLMPMRMAILNKTINKCLWRCKEKRNPHTVGGMQMSPGTMEISMEAPQKPKTRTTIWSSYVTSGCMPKESKSEYNRDTCTPVFTATLFIIAKF